MLPKRGQNRLARMISANYVEIPLSNKTAEFMLCVLSIDFYRKANIICPVISKSCSIAEIRCQFRETDQPISSQMAEQCDDYEHSKLKSIVQPKRKQLLNSSDYRNSQNNGDNIMQCAEHHPSLTSILKLEFLR